MKNSLLSVFLIFSSVAAVSQITVVLNPDADNTILSNTVANSNALGKLYVGNDCSFFNRRSLLYFDIAAAIPAGATITDVSLALVNDSMGISPMTLPFTLYPVLQGWGEGTSSGGEAGSAATPTDATWSSAMFGSTLWASPGGDYGAPSAVNLLPPSLGTYIWTAPDMAAELQIWLDAPATNFGWILIGAEGTNCATRRFGSKDSGSPPELTIEYTCPPPTAMCQDISLYLDDLGSVLILDDALDGGSTAVCGVTGFFASETSFDCNDIGGGSEMLITAIFDGPLAGGLPKGCEVYVRSDIADLSHFALGWANNGLGTDGIEFTFPAVAVPAGTYLYVASESTGFTTWFGFAPDYADIDANINGNDAVELFKDGSVVDQFGDPDVDGTGEIWEYMDGWAYRDDMTGPDAIFDDANWTYSGTDALDGETDNASAADPIPIGTFIPAPLTGVPVTLTVMESSGATDICIAYVSVFDTLPPQLFCSAFTTIVLDATGNATISAADVDAGTSDNCSLDSLWVFPATATCADIGSFDVTLYAVDVYGNLDSCVSTVTVDGSAVLDPNPDAVNDVTCPGDSDGSVDVTTTGGGGGYVFDWDNDGTGDTDDTEDLSGLSEGSYTLVVTDANGCSGSVTVTIGAATVIDIGVTQAGATLTADATGVTYQWIDCGTMTNITGETSQDFTATADGSYACVVTDAPCSDTTACIDISGVGFSHLDISTLLMFPNPADEQVQFCSATIIESLMILDMQGRTVLTDSPGMINYNLNISKIQAGSYLVKVRYADQSEEIRKLLID